MTELLDRLSNNRILSIEKLPSGRFRIWEECDHYFYDDFSQDEVLKICDEIRQAVGFDLVESNCEKALKFGEVIINALAETGGIRGRR